MAIDQALRDEFRRLVKHAPHRMNIGNAADQLVSWFNHADEETRKIALGQSNDELVAKPGKHAAPQDGALPEEGDQLERA